MKRSAEAARGILSIYFPLVQVFRNEFRDEAELTTDQFRILLMIRYDCNQIGKLAERNSISQPTMSKTIDLLVTKGFVRRIDHPTDRRQINLELTKKAESRVSDIWERVIESVSRRLAPLTASQQRTIATVFSEVTALLAREVP